MIKLKGFFQLSVEELKQTSRLKVYGQFPSSNVSEFKKPKDLPDDGILWSSFRLTGVKRLIGFFVSKESEIENWVNLKNTFFVVYLDKDHKFYISHKKNK